MSTTTEKKTCYRISSSSRGHTVIFQGPGDKSTYTPNTPTITWFFDFLIMLVIIGIGVNKNLKIWVATSTVMERLNLKSMLLLFGTGGNLYNLDEIERETTFYNTTKNIFSNLYSTWEKCVSLNCGNFCRTTHISEKHARGGGGKGIVCRKFVPPGQSINPTFMMFWGGFRKISDGKPPPVEGEQLYSAL